MVEGAPIERGVLEERLPPQRRLGALIHTAWAPDSTLYFGELAGAGGAVAVEECVDELVHERLECLRRSDAGHRDELPAEIAVAILVAPAIPRDLETGIRSECGQRVQIRTRVRSAAAGGPGRGRRWDVQMLTPVAPASVSGPLHTRPSIEAERTSNTPPTFATW